MAPGAGGEDEGWDLPPWDKDSFDLDKEMARNPRLQRQDLRELGEWAARQRGRGLPALRDSDLVKFLHSCDYDVLAAEQCMNHYFKSRAGMPSIFLGRDVRLPALKAQADVLDFIVLPRVTPDGCRILFNGLKDPDPANYDFENHQKLLMMVVDAILLSEPSLPGIYIIYDLELGLLAHFWKFGFFTQRKLFAYFQSGLPLRLKGIILLHTPSYISTVMRVLRGFCDRERLDETKMLTGDDYSELHKFLPKECLPSDYGGTLPSRRELHDMTVQRIDSLRDFFTEEEAVLKK